MGIRQGYHRLRCLVKRKFRVIDSAEHFTSLSEEEALYRPGIPTNPLIAPLPFRPVSLTRVYTTIPFLVLVQT